MGRKSKYSVEDKVKAVLDYKNGIRGMIQIGIDLGMSQVTAGKGSQLLTWVKKYDKYGESGFYPRDRHKSYSKEFKIKVVQEYLRGEGSLCDLCVKHDIPAETTLLNWVNSYNSHEELKDYNPKGDVYMTKSRKTTLEERIEIVKYCIDNDKGYKLAAEKFKVSYAQVYQWVKKYLESGEDGLADKRGKHKEVSQLSDLEKAQREIERLKHQLELKERENVILKKAEGSRKEAVFAKSKQEPKYITIKEIHEEYKWSISYICKVLGVPRCSYYKWLNRTETKDELENHELANLIIEYDERFNHILGYRRMTRWINKLNAKHYNHKRIRRIMKMLGIKSVIRRKKSKYEKVTTEIIAENILARDFYATKPNEKWATDVTEFKVIGSKQKLYLSAIIDLYDRSIVSYVVSKRNDNNLVFQTYEQAIQNNPEATPILHSDRGFQYTSKVFQTKLKESNITQSMSRVGRCIDNGPAEGFWGIIKSEMYYLKKFHSHKELKEAIDNYIKFYNNERFQERFRDMAPMEVRLEALNTTETPVQYPIKENKRIQKYYAQFNNQITNCAMA